MGVPTHAALSLHVSAAVHGLASSHGPRVDCKAGAGQAGVKPKHLSGSSHEFRGSRQIVPFALNWSFGQFGPSPVQNSSASQSAAGGRHNVPAGL